MKDYLTKKLGLMEKILEITREQDRFTHESDLSRFNLYLDETAKVIQEIKRLDRHSRKVTDAWSSSATASKQDEGQGIEALNETIRETIGKIAALQSEQVEHFCQEKKLLEEGLISHRKDARALTSYQDPLKSSGFLDIKK